MFKFIKSFIHVIQVAQKQRATFYTLSSLSDKELRDIGITRGDIPSILKSEFEKCSPVA
jgi:uncharacterized protein YjiS (DUF1127 family)